MRIKSLFLLFLYLLLLATGCTGNQKEQDIVRVESISINKQSVTLEIGDVLHLTASLRPSNARAAVSWKSSAPNVASVDQTGSVKALSTGTATITASADGKTATCEVIVKSSDVAVSSLTIDKNALDLLVNETFQLTATVSPSDATDKTVSWATSNAAIASVSDKGLVTAISEGEATITASAGGKSAVCKVAVTKSTIPVTGITLNESVLDLTESETFQLTATVSPSDATDKTVSWATSNAAIASVSDKGLVTAISEGEATIAASIGNIFAVCKVTVTKTTIPVTGITLNKSSLELTESETFQLTAMVSPSDATDKTVSWATSNAAIASVSDKGLVTAISEGEATIAASIGNIFAVCKVTVTKTTIPVTGITLNKSSLELTESETFQLTATITPSDATDKTVSWTTSNAAIASVSGEGLVTAISEGEATITASAGGKSAVCQVTVSAATIPVSSVTLNKTTLSIVETDSFQLIATVKPDNATNQDVAWSSAQPQIASVSDSGLVTGVSTGSTVITARVGDKSAVCTVTVTNLVIPPTSISLDQTEVEIAVGKAFTLTATVLPENTTNSMVSWSSSNKSVATVDQSGKVTAIKAGNVTITAKVGTLTATCAVTVITPVSSITLNYSTFTLKENETIKLIATIKPSNATYPSVSWATENPNVATVDENGNVTAISEGETVISALTKEMSASCTIVVSNSAKGGHEGIGTEVWD